MWAVKFEEVSKQYRHGGPRYPSLRHDLAELGRRAAARLRGHRAAPRGTVALDRVSFEVEEGESLALIGPNGAGKTTALRLVSRISYPTGGRVRVRGRVGALIEVGSGVHPELTGRENVWLYGSILGIARRDIARRFDEIVAFSELEHAIDTQVKYYSSGMQLRLGFSVASFLEPDIFVVDEALAVGDGAFQVRCVERMSAMVREGRTLIFVSHALPVVRELCSRAVLFETGRVTASGESGAIVATYVDKLADLSTPRRIPGDVLHVANLRVRSLRSGDHRIATDDPVRIEVDVDAETELPAVHASLAITDGRLSSLISLPSVVTDGVFALAAGRHTISCEIKGLPLLPGAYELWFGVSSSGSKHLASPQVIGTVVVTDGPYAREWHGRVDGAGLAPVHAPFRFGVDDAAP
jgi:ABC-type polysaccharide/polyol phosphate transport system ATPase subunit